MQVFNKKLQTNFTIADNRIALDFLLKFVLKLLYDF